MGMLEEMFSPAVGMPDGLLADLRLEQSVTDLSLAIPTDSFTGTIEECHADSPQGHGRFFCRCGRLLRQCRCLNSPTNPHRLYHMTDSTCAACAGWKHKFASTQINLPTGIAQHVRAFGLRIPREDLCQEEGDRGLETEIHCTLKYGINSPDVAPVRTVLRGEPPIKVRLGKVSVFPATDGHEFDVVKIDVDSPDLHRLNAKIAAACAHTDRFKTYKPHVTIAYVLPGRGKRYAGDTSFVGREFAVDEVMFSNQPGERTRIKMTGPVTVPEIRLASKLDDLRPR